MTYQQENTLINSRGTISSGNGTHAATVKNMIPEILFITSYPPKECGIATYSQDLLKAVNSKFSNSFQLTICAIESNSEQMDYGEDVKYILNTAYPNAFLTLAKRINEDPQISVVVIQHEFGFFRYCEPEFLHFLSTLLKPFLIVFHTVLPKPGSNLKQCVETIASLAHSVVVMTQHSAQILQNDYLIAPEKITVIPHGTHLVSHSDQKILKKKYQLTGKKILSTFGLLSSGKSIETTLHALPSIIEHHPDVQFLIIGKTHPTILAKEGEKYRTMLQQKIEELQLQDHVRFVPYFLALPDLLEYLQLTDIYLFTSRDPNQAVSGTFSYAISCGCPVISTPIPHAIEVLGTDAGIIVDFENPQQLSEAVIRLLDDEELRKNTSSNGLRRMASTAWENAAIAHAFLFEKVSKEPVVLTYQMPDIHLTHLKKMTTDFGIIQFSKINQPDLDSGYTLDDNARALIAMCQYYQLTKDEAVVKYIHIYVSFIKQCLQPQGYFLNYLNEEKIFTDQNHSTNLADSNGRAIWALGYVISLGNLLPAKIIEGAEFIIQAAILNINHIHSTRAMAFIIKGLYYRNLSNDSIDNKALIVHLANRLVQMYRHEADREWKWFESYLTYANSVLPEALLCAWQATGETIFKEIAKSSFDFLLSKIFNGNKIQVISNKSWLHKGKEAVQVTVGGEQPIDVAYTILALGRFYEVFQEEGYLNKMETAFSWFLGSNHLHQIMYNPCTGGCYDGLEEKNVNLNQGAESTVSYLMARLTMETFFKSPEKQKPYSSNGKKNYNLLQKHQHYNEMHV